MTVETLPPQATMDAGDEPPPEGVERRIGLSAAASAELAWLMRQAAQAQQTAEIAEALWRTYLAGLGGALDFDPARFVSFDDATGELVVGGEAAEA